ncbi:YitT family protein [Anaerosporobacter faecicola]|uniref:YitT family protein n=1 Tax=Anaerosporobacter faecicola TaxID=2718714 RepID=UPI00143CB50A|nr:YitT family protein [Anaerosporobacter faecicola]
MEILTKRSKGMDCILIILGTLLVAVSVNVVYEPLGMVTGGVSGVAIVIKYFTKNLFHGGIPIWFSNLIINIPLFLAAILLKGKRFVGKTLFATVCFTIALYIVPSFDVQYQDYLLASVFGGVIGGVGLGLVFLTSATTGGTDLFGMIIQKYFKHYTVPQLLIVIDGAIVLTGAAVFGLNKALYAVIAVYINSKVMDGILEGLKFAKVIYIISDQYEEISQHILYKMDRGVTGISARGMYSNKEKQMLFCVLSKKEIAPVVEIVSSIDKRAFIIVTDAREVMGEGFIEYRQEN